MTTGYVRQTDNSAACNRAGSPSPCGRYHLVTDWQGKPIATLDGAGKVAGYVEYEPHGFTNRAYVAKTVVGPTVAPYSTVFPVVTTSTVGASTAISAANSEVVSGRALLFNTDLSLINCPNAGQVLLNGTTALTQKGLPLKWAWTNWVQLTPTTPTTASGGQSATVTAKGDCSASPTVTPYYVEFRRAQKAVPHVFVPLRAPGQYFDEETDLFENWNRYYDPFKGVYLQPEPLLQSPGFVAGRAQAAMALPTYSYANNNPVSTTDETGLAPIPVPILSSANAMRVLTSRAGGIKKDSEAVKAKAMADFPNDPAGGPGDATRHCRWQCLLSREYSAGEAALVGYAWELKGALDGSNTQEDRKMDLRNNQCARDLSKNSDRYCESLCADALKAGHLQTLSPKIWRSQKPYGY